MPTKRPLRYLTHPKTQETKTIAQWARDLEVSHEAIRQRLANGWSLEDALSKPGKPREARAYAKLKTEQALATKGLPLKQLRERLKLPDDLPPLGMASGWGVICRLAELPYRED